MYIANELKILNNTQYNEHVRDNMLYILEDIVCNVICDKNVFELNNFYARYYDEFELKTNCNEEIYNTIYLEINQPLNYKPTKILKKSVKSKKLQFPDLYYKLEDILEDLYIMTIKTMDSNHIIWKDEYSVCIKASININDENHDYYYRIIPCLTYYNSNNVRGQMYKKNGGIEIEYIDTAIDNFNKKNELTKDKYRQTILIFKNLLLKEKNITTLPKEIIETMLYNVPNEMFKDDSKSTMINIINYIRNNSVKQFKTIDEEDQAFVSIYRSMSLIYVKHITKIIEKQLLK